MRRSVALVHHAIVAAATLALAGGAPAQDRSGPQRKSFFDTAHVNLINVEVFVTDRFGNPVTGLRREDFEVFEDGRRVEVTNFFAAEPAFPTPAPVAETGSPVGTPTDDVDLMPVEQRLSLVLLVDNTGITGAERNLALHNAREMVERCLRQPHAQAMVVTLDQHAHIRQGLTSDAELLGATLDRVEKENADPGAGVTTNAMIENEMNRVAIAPQLTDPGIAGRGGLSETQDFEREEALAILQAIRSNAAASHERTRNMLASLTDLMGSLAGLPGRKVVLYTGNGISLRPGETMLLKWQSRFGQVGLEAGFSPQLEAGQLSLSTEFFNLVARANAARVTFYAIDALGTRAVGGPSAEQMALDPDPGLATPEAMGKQQSLQHLAFATGGATMVAMPQTPDALTRVLRDLDTYYSLAYPAPRMGDGKDHSITVKVRREGVLVRHRRHYLDETADDRVVERNLSALLHNSGSNALGVEVVVGKPLPRKGGVFSVPLMIMVPLGKLVFLPEGNAHRGSISIFLAAKDLDDRITPPVKRQFPVSIPNATLQTALGQVASYAFEVVMSRGPQTVAVSVRDDVGETESTVTARFTVGEQSERPKTIKGELAPATPRETSARLLGRPGRAPRRPT